MNLQKNGLGE